MSMQHPGAVIIGTGSFLPKTVLTNADFEKLVDTTDEWIFTRTGIRERRIAEKGTATSDLAVEAARRALDKAGVKPEEINLIITATITPDHVFPATSCIVQHKLGATNAGGFDLEAACSGFVYGTIMASNYLKCNPTHTALVIGAETLSRITDYQDRGSCILFGDGAGAAVMRMGSRGRGLLDSEMGVDGSGAEMMILPAGGSRHPASEETVRGRKHYMVIHGREVFKFAVTKMGDLMQAALTRNNLKPDDVALVVPHQVNIRILEAAAERIGLPMAKVLVNIDRYGNTSAASVPIALDEANREGRIKHGDIVILMGFGGGLAWSCATFRW
jgi:3-oxoacyl-[acyl-carrier-protein] synthase III